MEDKKITVISNSNFTLFKGLTQKDLSGKNPAEHNRLNIRPTWSHGLDEKGRIQRFDFVQGDNECPDYIAEWESFKALCDNGTLSIKGSYTNVNKESGKSLADLNKALEDKKRVEEENEILRRRIAEMEAKGNISGAPTTPSDKKDIQEG